MYNNDNNAAAFLDTSSIPMISLDDSMNIGGISLSPYLKLIQSVKKTENVGNIEGNITEQELLEIPLALEEPKQDTAANQSATSFVEDPISKRTPKSLLKSRSKNHRLSLSTPRRRSSHIRALDFTTPMKIQSSRKPTDREAVKFSADRSKIACRSSLFTSPPLNNTTVNQNSYTKSCEAQYNKPPIATRSPAPKLQGGWERVNGMGLIIGVDGSPEKFEPSTQAEVKAKPTTAKKSWDEDLRKSLQLESEPEPVKSKSRKRTAASRKKNSPVAKKKALKIKTLSAAKSKKIKSIFDTSGEVQPDDSLNITKNEAASTSGRKSEESSEVKKYAVIKTLSTTLATSFDNNCLDDMDSSIMSNQVKASRESAEQHAPKMPNMMELETPRKTESLEVPPTPRIISPSTSTSITPFVKMITNENTKVQSLISTPEFPPTPNILLTPKEHEDKTAEGMKDNPYYEPSTFNSKESKTVETFLTTSKTEITQFEVIKGNLKAPKEIKINSVSSEKGKLEFTETTALATQRLSSSFSQPRNTSKEYDSESDSSSSTSNSDTSSDSNSSQGTNTTMTTNESPEKQVEIAQGPAVDNHQLELSEHVSLDQRLMENAEIEISNEERAAQTLVAMGISKNEVSPMKKFSALQPLVNTEEAKETPAKDENLLEADISETPSSSKAGVEIITNLHDKINHIMTSSQDETKKKKKMPKIINVQTVNVEVIDPPSRYDEQQKSRAEREEIRLRVLAKCQQEPQKPQRSTRSKKPGVIKQMRAKLTGTTASRGDKTAPISEANDVVKNTRARKAASSNKPRGNAKKKSNNSEESAAASAKDTRETSAAVVATTLTENPFKSQRESVKRRSNPENKGKKPDSTVDSSTDSKSHRLMSKNETRKPTVERVKRDLFSDEENGEQRATRSRTRETSVTKSLENAEVQTNKTAELPGVLECLQLVPANSSKVEPHDPCKNVLNASAKVELGMHELHFVFDDENKSPLVRKRQKKISESELSCQAYIVDRNNVEYYKMLTATPHEELFSLSPSPKRRGRVAQKKALDVSNLKPLATSSPLFKASQSTKASPKKAKAKSTNTKEKPVRTDDESERGKCLHSI